MSPSLSNIYVSLDSNSPIFSPSWILSYSPKSILSVLVCRHSITKYHRLGGLNKKSLFSHSSEGSKYKIKVLAGLVSPKASPLGLQMATFSPCPHAAFSLFRLPWYFPCKNSSHIELGPHPIGLRII